MYAVFFAFVGNPFVPPITVMATKPTTSKPSSGRTRAILRA